MDVETDVSMLTKVEEEMVQERHPSLTRSTRKPHFLQYLTKEVFKIN